MWSHGHECAGLHRERARYVHRRQQTRPLHGEEALERAPLAKPDARGAGTNCARRGALVCLPRARSLLLARARCMIAARRWGPWKGRSTWHGARQGGCGKGCSSDLVGCRVRRRQSRRWRLRLDHPRCDRDRAQDVSAAQSLAHGGGERGALLSGALCFWHDGRWETAQAALQQLPL
eukprot:366331-Chlamydomonas_euryale.AAC.23